LAGVVFCLFCSTTVGASGLAPLAGGVLCGAAEVPECEGGEVGVVGVVFDGRPEPGSWG
jgi:hypothetical protein